MYESFMTLDLLSIKFIVQIGVLALLIWLEAVVPFFPKRGTRLRHDTQNLGIGLFNGLVVALLFAGVTMAVTLQAKLAQFGLFHQVSLLPWVETLMAIVIFDLWMYLWHRANHRIPFLWRFHRMHHSDVAVDASSAFRFHTGEIIFSSLARLAVLPLLGMSMEGLILYETLMQPVILFHHSNVALPEKIDRCLNLLIVTPRMHWVHHSQLKDETDSNYASIFSFWDRIGRSFRRRRDPEAIQYGLQAFLDPEWQSIGGMLKTPLK